MGTVNSNIIFSATIELTNQIIDESMNGNYIEHKKKDMAHQLGLQIVEEKGWEVEVVEDRTLLELRLYVFTPQELKDFIDIKFQNKLEKMGITDENFINR